MATTTPHPAPFQHPHDGAHDAHGESAPPSFAATARTAGPATPPAIPPADPPEPPVARSAGPVVASIAMLFGLAVAAAFVGRELIGLLAGILGSG